MKIKLINQHYQNALPILNQIESHGYEAYFVGGCVRDTLLGRPLHDVDIATSALPEEIEQLFKYTFDVGKAHGTIVVRYHQESFEVTTFRTEGKYSDARRPDSVQFVRNLVEDTLRRDFTMNALAVNCEGELFDFHGGYADIQAQLIRAVGDAKERFSEDALRMIRAIRFASQLGFQIEVMTLEAIKDLAPKLALISIERVRIELTKYMQGAFFIETANLLDITGLFDYTLLAKQPKNLMVELASYLKPYQQAGIERSELLVWTLLIHLGHFKSQQERFDFLRNWKHSNHLIQDIMELIRLFELIDQNRLDLMTIYRVKLSNLQLAQEFYTLQHHKCEENYVEIKQGLPIQSRHELVINGKDLMSLLNRPKGGRMIGQWLEHIEEQVLLQTLPNDYPTIEAYVKMNSTKFGEGEAHD